MKNPLVSVVVINYNEKNLLKTVIDSIYSLDYKNIELLVVDNASTDGSKEFIEKNYKKVILVKNRKNLGYVGLNSAVKHCKGDYILFLNNDLELDKKSLTLLLDAAQKTKAAMAAPRLVNTHDKSLKSGGTWVSRAFYNGHLKSRGDEKIREIPYLGVGLIEKKVVDDFGYLFDDDYFIYSEDLDLGLRLRLIGNKVIFVPTAVMYHLHSATMGKSKGYKRTFLLEKNLLTTMIKNLYWRNIIIFFPYALLMRLIAAARDFFTLEFMTGFARIYAFFWVFLNIGSILKKRARLQKLRKMPDSYVLKLFSENEVFKLKKFNV
ncbi:MAG TPA: glycosyltransferase [Candidatus Nanoarchaeia archaeon]|nr:glycosyltransferase [Candidatus Nanoarchaeia archaeon]